MNKYQPTSTLFLDTRTKKSNGKYSLKLTIYCKPLKKRYATGIDLLEEEWKLIQGDNLRDKNLKEAKRIMTDLLSKANKVLDGLQPFSFIKFEEA